jgi:hypothetical protein
MRSDAFYRYGRMIRYSNYSPNYLINQNYYYKSIQWLVFFSEVMDPIHPIHIL